MTPSRGTGLALVLASFGFWLCWTLMPGVGITDTAQIFARVAQHRASVLASVVLQLASAAAYAPASESRGRVSTRHRGVASCGSRSPMPARTPTSLCFLAESALRAMREGRLLRPPPHCMVGEPIFGTFRNPMQRLTVK